MNTIIYHTHDIFDIKNVEVNRKYFEFCHRKALECGLGCKCSTDHFMKIELWGNKYQFIKYYFKTLTKCQNKMKGIKRLLIFITSKSKES